MASADLGAGNLTTWEGSTATVKVTNRVKEDF